MLLHIIELGCFFSGPRYIPRSVQTDVTTTTAKISWRVPAVENNLENYTVVYYGLDLQKGPKVIEWVAGNSTTPPSADSLYNITLENLEENNTYNYSVLATKCRGVTTSTTLQFTTISDCKFFCLNGSLSRPYRW